MNHFSLANQPKNNDKNLILKGRIILALIAIVILFVIYKILIPEIINIPVQKGYKMCYETIEENLSDHDNLEIQRAYCYRTKTLDTKKIMSSYSSSNEDFPDITYIYKFNFESEKTLGLKMGVYCGYNSETNEAIFFGMDSTYYDSEKNNATNGEYGNSRNVINSKIFSDIIEIIY